MMHWKANGKLLLTAEYLVLDGALALAVPVRKGQHLSVNSCPAFGPALEWSSLDDRDNPWFKARFDLPQLQIVEASDKDIAQRLQELLLTARRMQPGFLPSENGISAQTRLEFPREWGLGTSSTLVWLLAQWAAVNPFDLLFQTLGGSGYDVACAGADGPILYHIDGKHPVIQPVSFSPSFAARLWLVHLGRKQDSRREISRYRQRAFDATLVAEVSKYTDIIAAATTAVEFREALRQHESLVSRAIGLPRAKDIHFSDFPGEIKSLGAWGGDFVLALSTWDEETTRRYFLKRGFVTVIAWQELVLA